MEECKRSEPPASSSIASEKPVDVGATRSGGDGGQGRGAAADVPSFHLCAALVGHTGDVRSLAAGESYLYSGARDHNVMAWPLDKDGCIAGTHRTPAARVTLPDWVNALTVRDKKKNKLLGVEKEEVVVAGCNDAVIYAMGWKDGQGGRSAGRTLAVEKTLTGHNAPVCSLSWSSDGLVLLSGSWDETAKGWDLEASSCVWSLGGHENNVCVLGLGAGCMASGSTGLSVEGHLVGQQIRLWGASSPPKELRSLTEHTSGIRDLCLANNGPSTKQGHLDTVARMTSSSTAFCSASNDGTVRAWSADGDCRGVFTVPDESFVFSVRSLGGGLVAAGEDAGNLSAFRLLPDETPSKTQKASLLFKHPKTVWSVAALPTSDGAAAIADVATGSADAMVRVFTPDSARALGGDGLVEANRALRGATSGHDDCDGRGWSSSSSSAPGVSRGRGGFGGGDSLPLVSEMDVMVGREDGQLSAFADEATGGAQVFRWLQPSEGGTSKWELLGALSPPVRKVAFEGGLYDKVIPVEVESASRGFLFFQLGVNRGDDPTSVAAAFCEKHSLGPEYLPQIEQFLFIAAASSG